MNEMRTAMLLLLCLTLPASSTTSHSPKVSRASAPVTHKVVAPTVAPSSAPSLAPVPASPTPSPLSPAGPAESPGPAPGKGPPIPATKNGTLDPGQMAALQSLGVAVGSDPCGQGSHQILICDESTPFRHLLFLQLQYCPLDAVLTEGALLNLTSLQALSFLDCPMLPVPLPSQLISSLASLSCVASLGRAAGHEDQPGLPGVWVSHLHDLVDLTVIDVVLNVSSLELILANMSVLHELTISNTSLRGPLPKVWPINLTSVDLSLNHLQGPLPSFFGQLEHLECLDLSGNNLTGHLPESMGKLRSLQKLQLSSNKLVGPIPDAIINMTLLTYLDLSNNNLNGSILSSLATLTNLRYFDLRNNAFRGVLPLNTTFINRLNTFRMDGNPSLCYNSSITSSKVVSGLSPCDSNGFPLPNPGSGGPALAPGNEFGPSPQPVEGTQHSHKRHGPKTIVWAVAVALGAIIIFIVVAVAVSRWCRWKE
ncbi:hypothetical protein O6H91_04G062400 [Diphasiastrum complanatum]|uniref:Uncharacterized protein n=1 Tax=Diphasiastrum complanatum TaxID=34168 RepID=A0ACC2DXI2_DIPCM|nr:hypothetical protein O6H91_04G062400 [Diphasiastrum complanatum]